MKYKYVFSVWGGPFEVWNIDAASEEDAWERIEESRHNCETGVLIPATDWRELVRVDLKERR